MEGSTAVTERGNTERPDSRPAVGAGGWRPKAQWPSAEPTLEQVGIPVSVIAWTVSRWWPVLLVAGLTIGLLAGAVLGSAGPRYQSQSRVLIGSLQGPLDGLRASASLGASYADALASPEILRAAAVRAGLTGTDRELADAVAVTASDKSRLLTVEATWDSPQAAQRLATELTNEVSRLQQATPRSQTPPGLTPEAQQLVLAQQLSGQTTLVQAAPLPSRPVDTHRPLLSALAGLVGAFALFVALCFYIARRRRQTMAVRAAVRRDGLLGTLPIANAGATPVVLARPQAPQAREYQEAAAHTEVRASDGLTSLAVLSLRSTEISKQVASNLALAYALPGRSVTFVDASEQPSTVEPGHQGAASTDHDDVVEIGKGTLTTRRVPVAALRTRLAADADLGQSLTIVHLPPVFDDRAGLGLAGLCAHTVLVADERERAVAGTLADARAAIERRGGRVVGTVLAHRRRLLDRLCDAPE